MLNFEEIVNAITKAVGHRRWRLYATTTGKYGGRSVVLHPYPWRKVFPVEGNLLYNGEAVHFELVVGWLKRAVVAEFKMLQLPGCCGVVMSTGENVRWDWRRRGINTALGHLRIFMACMSGYTTMLCTDVLDNKPQRKILEKQEWKDVHSFTNRRTGNHVAISVRDLC